MEAVTPSGQQRDDMGLLVRGNALRMRGREGHGRRCTEERRSIATSLIGHSLSGRYQHIPGLGAGWGARVNKEGVRVTANPGHSSLKGAGRDQGDEGQGAGRVLHISCASSASETLGGSLRPSLGRGGCPGGCGGTEPRGALNPATPRPAP